MGKGSLKGNNMNKKLEAILEEWEKKILSSSSGGYDEATRALLPLLEERVLSFEEVFIIWAVSKRNSKLELKARFILLANANSAQDELELEIAKRIESSNDSKNEEEETSVRNWVREVVIKEVPNLFVSVVMEKGQTYLL